MRRFSESGGEYYVLREPQIDPLDSGSGGTIETGRFNGINTSWTAMERYMETAEFQLPQDFIYPSALACLGTDPLIRYVPDWSDRPCYQYEMTLPEKTNTIYLKIQNGVSSLPYNTTKRPAVSEDGFNSMLKVEVPEDLDAAIIYNRNGLIYTYSYNGSLMAIEWIDDGTYFCLSHDSYLSWVNWIPRNEEIPEDSILMRLLSLDDAVAMQAWRELKASISLCF